MQSTEPLHLTYGFLDWNGNNENVIFRLDWWCDVRQTVCFPKAFLCNLISCLKKAQNIYLKFAERPHVTQTTNNYKYVAVTKKWSAWPTSFHIAQNRFSYHAVTLTQSFFYRHNTEKNANNDDWSTTTTTTTTTTGQKLHYSAPHFFNGEWGPAERLFRFHIVNDIKKLDSFVKVAQRRQELRWQCKRRNQQFLMLCDNIKKHLTCCLKISSSLHFDTMASHQITTSSESNNFGPKVHVFTYGTLHYLKDGKDGFFILTNDSLDRYQKSIRFYRNSLRGFFFALKDACEQARNLRNSPNFSTYPDGEYYFKEITSHSLRKARPMRVILEVVILERTLYVYVKNQWFNRNPPVEKTAPLDTVYPLVNCKNGTGQWEHCKGAFRIDPEKDDLDAFQKWIAPFMTNSNLSNSVAHKMTFDDSNQTSNTTNTNDININDSSNSGSSSNNNNNNNNRNDIGDHAIRQLSQLTETLV